MPPAPIVLHSSPVRLVLSTLTPPVLLALGIAGLSERIWLVPIALAALGAMALVTVLVDLPRRSEFDAEGVTRICLLRRHRLTWSEIVALERIPKRRRRTIGRSPAGATPDPAAAHHVGAHRRQGLVARVGPRRVVLLVDRRESFREYEALRSLIGERGTSMRATPPPLDASPAGRGPDALHHREAGH